MQNVDRDSAHKEHDNARKLAAERQWRLCLDLGPDFEDPEGWMAERLDYWAELAATQIPSLEKLLRHRLADAWQSWRASVRPREHRDPTTTYPREAWVATFEAAIGIAPRADEPTVFPATQRNCALPRPRPVFRRFALDTPPESADDDEANR